MQQRLKERLIGAAVLLMLAVIFIPMILDNSSHSDLTIDVTNIPEKPEGSFSSRIVPLQEHDNKPDPAATEVVTEAVTEAVTVISQQENHQQASPLPSEFLDLPWKIFLNLYIFGENL